MQYPCKYKNVIEIAGKFCAIFIVFLLFSSVVCSQPKIKIKEGTEFKFGEVKEGRKIEKKLTVLNVGTMPLFLENIRTSCGCTVVKTPQKEIAPNRSEVITISIDSKGFTGPLKKEVYIDTNDPLNKELTITMFLTVRNIIEFIPTFVNFHDIPLGVGATKTVEMLNTSEKSITITSFSSPESQISIHFPVKVIPPRSSITFSLSVNPLKKGQILGQIELKTDHPDKPLMQFSYIGKIH